MQVGPYAVIDEGVRLGANCVVGPYVYLTGDTVIGEGNRFFAGSVVGEAPQDLKYRGENTALRMGDNNRIRENATVHRSAKPGCATVVGSNNLLMAGCHVAHDCVVGNFVILANGALLGGHVEVGDRAVISGNCLVHQFVRVGTLAMMQGGSAISQDLPPYTVAMGDNTLCGLNTIGLRRAGMTPAERLELKQLYRALFRSHLALRNAVEQAETTFSSAPARKFLEFVKATRRGICGDISSMRSSRGAREENEAGESAEQD